MSPHERIFIVLFFKNNTLKSGNRDDKIRSKNAAVALFF